MNVVVGDRIVRILIALVNVTRHEPQTSSRGDGNSPTIAGRDFTTSCLKKQNIVVANRPAPAIPLALGPSGRTGHRDLRSKPFPIHPHLKFQDITENRLSEIF